MNSISDLITDKAEEMFPENNTSTDNELDLEDYSDVEESKVEDKKVESTDAEYNSEVPMEIGKEDKTEEKKETNPSANAQGKEEKVDMEKLKTKIYSLKDQLDSIIRLIEAEPAGLSSEALAKEGEVPTDDGDDKILQGTFDGEKMIGKDGKEYAVAPNYASKSKLVEGDTLKLTITDRGKFIYKQVSPAERVRRVGKLTKDASGNQWYVQDGEKRYKVLTASVTFYRGVVGDEVVFFVAKDIPNSWAAVDNIVKNN